MRNYLSTWSSSSRHRIAATRVALVAMAWAAGIWLMPPPSLAVSCTTQSQMTEAQRNSLAASAKSLAALVQAGNTAGLEGGDHPFGGRALRPHCRRRGVGFPADRARHAHRRVAVSAGFHRPKDHRRRDPVLLRRGQLARSGADDPAASAGELRAHDSARDRGRVSAVDYLYPGAGVGHGDAVEAGRGLYSWADLGRT